MKKLFLALALMLVSACAHAQALRGGFWLSKTQRASAPTGTGITSFDRLWYKSSNGHLIHTDTSNVDHDLDAGGGGTGTLANVYGNGTSNTDETVGLDNTRKGVLIKDAASPITPITGLGLFDVTDNAATSLFFDVTRFGINSFGPFGFGTGTYSAGSNGWWYMANTTAASGGATLQNAPDLVLEGKAWDGSASRTIGSIYNLTAASPGGASYATQLKITLKRNASFVTPLDLRYDGTNTTVSLPGGTIGADSTHQNFFPNVNGDTFALLGAAQTLNSKTLTGVVLALGLTASGISAYNFSGSSGTFLFPTGGLASDLAISTDNTYVVGDGTHRLSKFWTTKIGGGSSNTNGHTVPNVADSTFALLAVAQNFTKDQGSASSSITDGATINTDCSASNTFTVTLAGNRTLANPTNVVDGHDYQWRITQDGTGNRTLAYGGNFHFAGGSTPVLTTTASKTDLISCKGGAASVLYCSFLGNFTP